MYDFHQQVGVVYLLMRDALSGIGATVIKTINSKMKFLLSWGSKSNGAIN